MCVPEAGPRRIHRRRQIDRCGKIRRCSAGNKADRIVVDPGHEVHRPIAQSVDRHVQVHDRLASETVRAGDRRVRVIDHGVARAEAVGGIKSDRVGLLADGSRGSKGDAVPLIEEGLPAYSCIDQVDCRAAR